MKSCSCSTNFQKGDKGEIGQPGPRGPIGYTGVMGLRGFTGSNGDKGLKGEPGIIGKKGEKGNSGLDGNSGIKGETGSSGIGITNISSMNDSLEITYGSNDYTITVSNVKGVKGCQGDQGIPGTAANKGDTGPRGLTGIKGEPGSFSYMLPNITYLSIEKSPSFFCKDYFTKYNFYPTISSSWLNLTNRNLLFTNNMAINKDYIKNFYIDLDIDKKEKIIKLLLVCYQENYKKHYGSFQYCNTYLDSILVKESDSNICKIKLFNTYYLGGRSSDLSFNLGEYIDNFEEFDFLQYFESESMINIINDSIIVPFGNYYRNNINNSFTPGPVTDYIRQNKNMIAISNTFLVNIRHISDDISDDKLEFYQNFTGKHRKLEKGMLIIEFVNPNSNCTVSNLASSMGINTLGNDDSLSPTFIFIVNYFNHQTGYFSTLDLHLQTPKLYENFPIIGILNKSLSLKGYFDFDNMNIRMSMFFNPVEDIGINSIYCGNLPEDQENGIDYIKDPITNLNVPIVNYYGNNNILFEFLENLNESSYDSNYLKAITGLYDIDTITTGFLQYYLTGMISNN